MDKSMIAGGFLLLVTPYLHWYLSIIIVVLLCILALNIWQSLEQCRIEKHRAKLYRERRKANADNRN